MLCIWYNDLSLINFTHIVYHSCTGSCILCSTPTTVCVLSISISSSNRKKKAFVYAHYYFTFIVFSKDSLQDFTHLGLFMLQTDFNHYVMKTVTRVRILYQCTKIIHRLQSTKLLVELYFILKVFR